MSSSVPTARAGHTLAFTRSSITSRLVRVGALPTLAGCVYAGLVLALWAPFGPRNGMPYETAFVYVSETTSFFDGYEYLDELRRWTQLFYTLGYRFSDLLGVDGSFLGLQLVYALLWWARGLLTFLIVRRLAPSSPLVALAAGALVLVHASDHALNWVGQLNQFGVIFWMLLSIYLLVVGLQQQVALPRVAAVSGAAFAAYMSLWSYESPLFILTVVPLLLVLFLGLDRSRVLAAGAYLLVPLYYLLKNVRRYVGSDGSSYQESVLRDDRNPTALLSDLWFNVDASLRFWNWGDGLPPVTDGNRGTIFAVTAAALFALGAVLVEVLTRPAAAAALAPTRRLALLAVGAGIVLLASFPAYVVLTSARQLWRTQFLAGVGTGVLFAAILGLAASTLPRRAARPLVVGAVGALVVFFGVRASYQAGSFHYSIWDRHRDAIAEMLEVAPRVRPDTVVVLTGVPKGADPFGDNMWFDMAVRLAYPATSVAGVYFYVDGTPSPSQNMIVTEGEWQLKPIGFPTLVSRTSFENTIILRYNRDGKGDLIEHVPGFVSTDPSANEIYRPGRAVVAGPPSKLAERRYLGEDDNS